MAQITIRMFRMHRLMCCLLLMAISGSHARAQWEDVSIEYLVEASCTGSYLGCGLSCVDFNADGKDDLTIGQASGVVSLYLRTEEGFVLDQELLGTGQATGVLWVDVEGDGDLDVFVGRLNEGVRLHIRADDGTLVDETLERGIPDWQGWQPRGISAADFDNDQDLDVYVASYHIDISEFHYPNVLLVNDGAGYFTLAGDSVGVNDGIKTSFHGGWLDFDRDGWQDLWVINDRPSFKNAMYRNQGDGTFVDMVLELGLLNVTDPMTATVFDPDQDGDWDLFCTEVSNAPSSLFEQTDSGFVDVAVTSGVGGIEDFGWGGCVIDIDGDAREDLMVATLDWPSESPVDNRMYMALDSGLAFEEDELGWPNEQFPLYHLGRFDLDGDRAPDILGHGAIPVAQVLRNTNENGASRMTVRLVGTTTNSHAVGALIEVYANGNRQMQQVDAGTDYVTQHTYCRFFGMDSLQTLDSLVVTWPGAGTETWYGLDADTAHVLVQGSAGAMPLALDRVCPWDEQGWLLPELSGEVAISWDGVPWSSDTVWANDAADHVLEAFWWGETQSIQWVLNAEVVPVDDPDFECTAPACFGDSAQVSWSATGTTGVIWMDSVALSGDTLMHVAVDSIHVEWQYGLGCAVDTSLMVSSPELLTLTLDVDQPACFGGTANVTFESNGGTPPIELSWGEADPATLTAGIWPVVASDSVGCIVMDTVTVQEPPALDIAVNWNFVGDSDTASVALEIGGGTPPYSEQWTGGLDSAGWAVAPVVLFWTVQDSAGCAAEGLLDIALNGLPSPHLAQAHALSCWRTGGAIGFEGPAMKGQMELFDLTGRLMWSGGWSTSDRIPCGLGAPVIVRVVPEGGFPCVFLR